MARWFRFYEDAVNDPKVQRLDPKLFKAWVNMLCLASMNDGWLPAAGDVAFTLRVTEAEAGRLVDGLVSSGLIDEYDGRFTPHNWNGRQFKSDVSNERVKRHRQRKCNVTENVTENVTVTPPETETETETETEKKKETRASALLSFDLFWDEWPNKVGKPAAQRALKAALTRAPLSEILTGVQNYIRDKPPDRPWLNPATFLNQNRWEDRPAEVGTKNGTPNNQSGSLLASIKRELAELEAEAGTDPALPSGNLLRLSDGSIR